MLKVVFTGSTIFTASSCSKAGVSATRGKSILLSRLVRFLMRLENSAASVLFCADLHPTVIVVIGLLTVYNVCTDEPDVSATATVIILWAGCVRRGVVLAGGKIVVGWGLGAGAVVCCTVLRFRSLTPGSCCLSVCCLAAAAVTLASGIVGAGGAIVVGTHVAWGVMTDTVLLNSKVRSCT